MSTVTGFGFGHDLPNLFGTERASDFGDLEVSFDRTRPPGDDVPDDDGEADFGGVVISFDDVAVPGLAGGFDADLIV